MIKHITHKPPRLHQDNALYFITFCTYKREPLLHRKGIPEMLIDNLAFYGKRLKELIAYTVMPDHIHLLLDVVESKNLSAFLRDFKKFTSKEIKRTLDITNSHIWHGGSMDHCIRFSWTNNDLHNHLQYIFYNSWKHLNMTSKDFPFHNFIEVVEKGWLDIDFCAFDESVIVNRDIYE